MEKIPDIIDESWHPHLQYLFDNPKMNIIKNQILPSCKFFPAKENIFRVFKKPLGKIKVVILGQDPYPNGEGIGYSFAVNQDTVTPPSLKIIRQEIINSGAERDTSIHIESGEWKPLKHWVNQGIFLLNSALTVEAYNKGSHLGLWEWFTREVVNIISTNVSPVWLLWGARAKGFKYYIQTPKIVLNNGVTTIDSHMEVQLKRHIDVVLESDHPAVETYKDSKYKFYGCNHFKLCNQILKLRGETIINW